jgi:hypothetical protein
MDISNDILQIISIITSPQLQKELLPVKALFIFFSIAFLAGIIYMMSISSYLSYQFLFDLKAFFALQPRGLQRIFNRWKKIQNRIETGTEYEYKLAIIEADSLLNDTLEDNGFSGKTFEERIKKVDKVQLPNSEEILEVHKTRNSIVYDPDYKLEKNQAKQILEAYERGIKNIESF